MKISVTKIPDVTKSTIDQSKVILANNIIQNVYPLFDEIYQEKIGCSNEFKTQLNEKKNIVQKKKKELEELMTEYNKEKKVSKLLTRIEKLVNSGLVYEGSIKNQTIVLLKVMNKLTSDKLDHHLTETLQIIRKRFSRS